MISCFPRNDFRNKRVVTESDDWPDEFLSDFYALRTGTADIECFMPLRTPCQISSVEMAQYISATPRR